jgi:phosphonoacetaldehyde hydrolase
MISHVKAVVFDWAGTMVDFGSFAPMKSFVAAFEAFGVSVTLEEARGPMGLPKRDHIRTMIHQPRIAHLWHQRHGAAPTDTDIDAILAHFEPVNAKVAAAHADLIPGALDMLAALDQRGIKVGSTTGYTRLIMQSVLPVAAAQGYAPLNCVCSDDLLIGRPGPLGMYQSMVDLGVFPVSAVVKVDDTAPGIAEGVAAGCPTVGIALSGNHVGLTVEELAAASEADIAEHRASATKMLKDAGADYVIDTVADLPKLLG